MRITLGEYDREVIIGTIQRGLDKLNENLEAMNDNIENLLTEVKEIKEIHKRNRDDRHSPL